MDNAVYLPLAWLVVGILAVILVYAIGACANSAAVGDGSEYEHTPEYQEFALNIVSGVLIVGMLSGVLSLVLLVLWAAKTILQA